MDLREYQLKAAETDTLRLDLTNCTIQQLGTIDNKGLVKMSDDRNSLRNSGTLSVGRDLVQARDITRSFNALADKVEGREVADKLRQLALSLNSILADLQADQAERLAKDAEKFAEEAAEESPRKEVLDVLGKALLGTVKLVASGLEPLVKPLVAGVIAAAFA